MKKRIMALALVAFALLSASGCGGNSATNNVGKAANKSEKQDIADTESVGVAENTKSTYSIGETWTIDGQWSLTVTGVEETDYRNEYSDKTPEAVYILNYSYTNLGYTDPIGLMDGLFFGMDSDIVDSTGLVGYSYPGEYSEYPQEIPEGATCNAQSCVGVDNAGDFKVYVTLFDGTETKQTAIFEINVE